MQYIQLLEGTDNFYNIVKSEDGLNFPNVPNYDSGNPKRQIASVDYVSQQLKNIGGGGTWGSITGTLSAQTDLSTALNGKLATNGSAASLINFPTLNQNTTGNAATVTTIPSLSGDVYNSGNVVNTTKAVGLLYQKSYWTGLTDFTASGFTPTVSGAGITFTGGSNTYTQIMGINGFTSTDPNIDIELAYTIGTTGHGIGIGRNSRSVQSSVVVQYDETTNQLIFTSLQGAGTVLATVSSNFTVANGNNCVLRYSQKGNIVTGTFTDLSFTGGTFSYSVPLQTAGYSSAIPNTSDVTFYNIGGTRTISSIIYKSRSLFRPDIAYNGDSKTVGLGTSGAQFRWANQLGSLGSFEVFAGGGDKVADLLAGSSYIINYIKPKSILINVLRNDLSGGTLTTQNKTDYQSLVTAYQTAGIIVYHLLPIPETVIADQSAINTFINATYSSANIIDPSSGAVSFVTGTMLAGDGIHLNVLGNTTVGANILNAAKITTSTTVNPFISIDPLITYPVTYTTGGIFFGQGTSAPLISGAFNFNTSTNKMGIGLTSGNVVYSLDIDNSNGIRSNGTNQGLRLQRTRGTDAALFMLVNTAGNFASNSVQDDIVIENATAGKNILFSFSAGASVLGISSSAVTFGLAAQIAITEGTGGRVGQVALVSGTKAITISGLTSSSRAFRGFVSQGGTSTSVYEYAMVCTTNTLTITAITVTGSTVTTDTSTINYFVVN